LLGKGERYGQYLAFGRLLVMLDLHEGACELYVPDA
jgi:hypothetical protein